MTIGRIEPFDASFYYQMETWIEGNKISPRAVRQAISERHMKPANKKRIFL